MVKIRAIVIVVSLLVALIEDQVDGLPILPLSRLIFDDVLIPDNAKKAISIIILNFRNAAIDKNI